MSRRLVYSMFASLDGYVEAAGKRFVGPEWSDDLQAWAEEVTGSAGALVYGRVTYQGMIQHWPAAEQDSKATPRDRAFARLMNTLPKHVFSRSLREVSWNARLESGDPVATMERLKAEDGKPLVCFGGPGLASVLVRAGLVDEYRVLLIPTLFGGGTRMFEGGHELRPLERIHVKSFDTGAVSFCYRPRA